MIKLITEETITENVITQIIYKEAKIDLECKNYTNQNYGEGLFKRKSVTGIKPVYYDRYKCIEGDVSEYSIRILTTGLVFKNDWYITYRNTSYSSDKSLTQLESDDRPFTNEHKVVGINDKGYDAIAFITNEQISEIVNILNNLDKDERTPTLAIPMRLVTTNGKFTSETIIANEDGSFPFLTMKDYTIAKELSEPKEE